MKKFFGRRQKYASNEKDILGINRKMRNGARWTKCFALSPSFVLNRYGLRTNSLMLLGLCLGWIFGILSFHKDKDVVFQLSFGLVNGLQVGIFSNIVYIHKVISRMNSWCNFKRNDVITPGEIDLSLGFWFRTFPFWHHNLGNCVLSFQHKRPWIWFVRKVSLLYANLRKQPTFRDATTGFPAKWRLRNKRRNSILMTRHYPASDWSYTEENLFQPIRSTTQIWIVTRHQYGISELVSQTSFRGGNPLSDGAVKCQLFSQATFMLTAIIFSCFRSRVYFCSFFTVF